MKAWSSEVQQRLISLRDAREAEKAHEQDLIRQRKEIVENLRELGALPGASKLTPASIAEGKATAKQAEILMARSDYTHVIFALQFSRDRQRVLSDKIDSGIKEASQGKLQFAEDDDTDIVLKARPTEADLFSKKAKSEPESDEDPKQGTLDTRPVGRRHEAPVAVGENQHLAVSITELGLADHVCANLKQQGFETVNHLVLHQNKGKKFIEIHKLSEVGAKEIEKALSTYLKKHIKAQVDKDLGRGDEQIRNQRGPRVGKGAPVGKKDTPKAPPAKAAAGKCGKCNKSKGVKWANESKTLCEGCAEKALDGAKA